jgi:hypothetical protein
MRAIIAALVLLALTGCATRRHVEYYESGAVKSETVEDGFTLGTQGLGEYYFINLSAF